MAAISSSVGLRVTGLTGVEQLDVVAPGHPDEDQPVVLGGSVGHPLDDPFVPGLDDGETRLLQQLVGIDQEVQVRHAGRPRDVADVVSPFPVDEGVQAYEELRILRDQGVLPEVLYLPSLGDAFVIRGQAVVRRRRPLGDVRRSRHGQCIAGVGNEVCEQLA
jgi:hypothetical protein